MNAVAIFEKQLAPLAPRFAEVLGRTMPVERLIRTVVLSVERLPKLLECDKQSLFNAAMSAAVLGLEVDGVTGQAFLIPFKNRAQLVIGYKGFNTLGARAGITITGACVRDGDAFDFDLAEGWITHKPALGSKARIVAAWAKAAHMSRPPVIVVLSIDELLAVKAKSPGAQRTDSPWNDTAIGFPAMCEKTAKRRLARSLPLNSMQLAARMDEAVDEQGKPSWISADHSVVVDGTYSPIVDAEVSPTPTAQELISPPTASQQKAGEQAPSLSESPPSRGEGAEVPTPEQYIKRWQAIKDSATNAKQLHDAWTADKAIRKTIDWKGDELKELTAEIAGAIEFLKG